MEKQRPFFHGTPADDRPRMPPPPEYPHRTESMGDILRRAGEPLAPEQSDQGATNGDAPPADQSVAMRLNLPIGETVAETRDPLAELARLIEQPPRVPDLGVKASEAMRQAFERVASEIEAVARDGVSRANENLQEALSFAEVMRQSGRLLGGRIEGEAVRALQISRVMRGAREAFSTPSPEGGES